MHTVVETPAYLSAAKDASISDSERSEIVSLVAEDPMIGAEMRWTGGCRKFRVAGRGRGKSGGFRVVHFYAGPDVPVFLLTAFGKGEKDNLTRAEANALAALTKRLADAYRNRVAKLELKR
ncbi:type II toxin-antitoxin system RelE/ParE family toxin [Fulvimarina sp. MAC3]|uniref:type II toxin-antitoxin system RelE/ParE family toxin n=1 Tax=Fulvimarina sp. MAC3 TaxID=3148887 RepID=UPI0031FE1767